MEEEMIAKLNALLDERTMTLMERESDLADRLEEIDAQKEELTAAIEELQEKNNTLQITLTELKERNNELDQIIYRTSHDLRSPVTSIVGILNILKYEKLTETQQACIEHIRDKSIQMDELLMALSTLAKTIMNDLIFCKFNIHDLLQECVADLALAPNFHAVNIQVYSQGNTTVYSDRLLTNILIKNLLANALTFRDPLKPGSIIVKSWVTDTYFKISIQDDGEGISELIKENIYKIFYRGSERSVGSGLGLYIAHKIVEQLKGHIDFTSKDGLTTFEVELPNVHKIP